MGSSVAIDTLALHDRKDPMAFEAAKKATHAAGMQAGIMPIYTDMFELDDSYSIYAALTLEACGFAEKGDRLADGDVTGCLPPPPKLPAFTMGGCKARGNPLGAKGVLPGSGSHSAITRISRQKSGRRCAHRPHPGIGRSGINSHRACAGEGTVIQF